jgi:hypothetical protein
MAVGSHIICGLPHSSQGHVWFVCACLNFRKRCLQTGETWLFRHGMHGVRRVRRVRPAKLGLLGHSEHLNWELPVVEIPMSQA